MDNKEKENNIKANDILEMMEMAIKKAYEARKKAKNITFK